MKKKIRSIVAASRNIPTAVLLTITVILNYLMGKTISDMNSLYSSITNYSNRNEFIAILVKLIVSWVVIRLVNSIFGKIQKNKLLDESYLKWIVKLTRSKLSSITNVTTGAANSAISAISMDDKTMLNCVVGIIPSLVPFFILCKREFEEAGFIPPMINIICMTVYVAANIKLADSKAYKDSATARAHLHSVTLDCIRNSQTVKYFGVEDWSINRQENTQKEVFVDFLALPAVAATNMIDVIMFIPTAANVFLCWGNTSTVLFIIMMSYSVDNIAGYIGIMMEALTDKKNQMRVLGKLETDDVKKEQIKEKLEIHDVEFQYEEKSKVIFKICYLQILTGHRYCITGKSGFGKSTLAKIITGTNAPTKGYVPAVESIYMFAESELFDCSIAENISLGEVYDRAEIEELCREFEINLDIDLYNESVGENGGRLSTGQKQRINLCRTLFYARRHPGSLIVMDEVTAALDIKTSLTCLKYLTSEFNRLKVTLIYISNKSDYLETGLITDDIYVHRTGNVVTYDTIPEED